MSKTDLQNLDYCQKAINLKNSLETTYLELGEQLYQIKEKELFKANWETWEEFTWELRMTSNSINKLIQIYKTLVLGYGFTSQEIGAAGGWTLIADVLPMITSKDDAVVWLKNAETLTRADLRKTIKEKKTGVSMSECKHKNTYTIEICSDCGERWKRHEKEQLV